MLKKGDLVRIRKKGSEDDWCQGVVKLASENGESVGLFLDGTVRTEGGLVSGALPLIVDNEHGDVRDIFGGEYEVEVGDMAVGRMCYFGQRHPAPIYQLESVPVPVGETCVFCEEPILDGEDGFLDAGKHALHRECMLYSIFGSVSHQMKVCRCYKGPEAVDCEDGLSMRQGAKLALAHMEAVRGFTNN